MKVIPRLHILVYLISASLTQCLAVDYRYFVAGGVCAAYSHGITTPIDVIKTRMQADPKEFNAGMLSAAAKIVKKDGPGVRQAAWVQQLSATVLKAPPSSVFTRF
jgi:hypothetical protein